MTHTNYIFVDYENVRGHDMDLSLLEGLKVEVIFIFGKRQNDVPVELVQAMLRFAGQFRIEKLSVEGKNALDFVLAYHIGKASALDPAGHFFVFSKDTDYDPLMIHLRAHHIKAHRYGTFAEIPCLPVRAAVHRAPQKPTPPAPAPPPARTGKLPPASKPKTPDGDSVPSIEERVKVLVEQFSRTPRTRPKREKTLRSSLNAFFGKRLSEEDVSATVAALVKRGSIEISDKGVVNWTFLI